MLKSGKKIELFVDDTIIESSDNIKFELNHPQRREQVISFDQPWEALGSLGTSVLYDGEKIMLYYRGFPSTKSADTDENQVTCLAVSTDGVNFEKYPVNKINYHGNTNNNIVCMGINSHNFSPFYDVNPNIPSDEKYKAVGGIIQSGGLHMYGSSDGLEWKNLFDKPSITDGAFDSINIAFYDKYINKYRCYSRYFSEDTNPLITKNWGNGFRAIQSCVSDDFTSWNNQVKNNYIGQDSLYEHFYTNATAPIPGAEHILISIPMRYFPERTKVLQHSHSGISDCIFMTTRDGVNWHRIHKKPWIYPDLNLHNWTERSYITLGGIIDINDEFNIYVTEKYRWYDGGIVRYTIPKYRFSSLYSDIYGGEFITKKDILSNESLYINYNTSAYGSISLALLNDNNQIIEGYSYEDCGEIYGNELEYEVLWGGKSINALNLSGEPIKIAIKLKDAYLYAMGDFR